MKYLPHAVGVLALVIVATLIAVGLRFDVVTTQGLVVAALVVLLLSILGYVLYHYRQSIAQTVGQWTSTNITIVKKILTGIALVVIASLIVMSVRRDIVTVVELIGGALIVLLGYLVWQYRGKITMPSPTTRSAAKKKAVALIGGKFWMWFWSIFVGLAIVLNVLGLTVSWWFTILGNSFLVGYILGSLEKVASDRMGILMFGGGQVVGQKTGGFAFVPLWLTHLELIIEEVEYIVGPDASKKAEGDHVIGIDLPPIHFFADPTTTDPNDPYFMAQTATPTLSLTGTVEDAVKFMNSKANHNDIAESFNQEIAGILIQGITAKRLSVVQFMAKHRQTLEKIKKNLIRDFQHCGIGFGTINMVDFGISKAIVDARNARALRLVENKTNEDTEASVARQAISQAAATVAKGEAEAKRETALNLAAIADDLAMIEAYEKALGKEAAAKVLTTEAAASLFQGLKGTGVTTITYYEALNNARRLDVTGVTVPTTKTV